jgi:hypothetical protein
MQRRPVPRYAGGTVRGNGWHMRTNHSVEVETWLVDRSHPLDEAMREVREVILGVDDRISECIKWSTPTFVFRGNMASFNPSKSMVSLMFHRGAEIPGNHPLLQGDGKLVRTMRFADVDEVVANSGELAAVVRAWCESRNR